MVDSRKPMLPMLPMPPRNSSLDMPAFAFPSASSSGTSTPCYSDGGGMSLPHTPLPGTPLGLDKHWAMMITPTPTHNHPFTFDFNPHPVLPRTESTGTVMALEDEVKRSQRQSARVGSGWSVDSGAVGEEDDLEWDDREEGIILSFLDNPLHPLSTPFPPGTLPPSAALDDITSQIIRFHSPPTPLGTTPLDLTRPTAHTSLGLTSSTSAPSLPTAARKHTSKHRRTHSASGIPWKHSWRATRAKLYEIARREALGARREDRFKGRVIDSPPGADVALEAGEMEIIVDPKTTVTPHPSSLSSAPTARATEVTDTPEGRMMKRPSGGIIMQRHGSETMLEFPDVPSPGVLGPMDEEAGRIGQALRLSSTLQRSTKAGECRSGRSMGIQRKPSLLQRGQSFTADEFNACLSLSSDDALGFGDQDCTTPSAVFDTQTPTLQTALDTTTPQQEPSKDLFGDMFGQHTSELVSPPSSIFGPPSDPCDVSMDEVIPATPDHAFLPSILLTKTSPTPMIHARNGSGSSEFEMVPPSALFKGTPGGLGTPLNLSPPGSPKSHHPSRVIVDLDRTPRPVVGVQSTRPGLIRARSSTAAHKTTSAFSQFMKHTPCVAPVIPVETEAPPVARSLGLGLAMPTAKRQKLGFGMTIPIPGAAGGGGGLDSGLASPFDEKKTF